MGRKRGTLAIFGGAMIVGVGLGSQWGDKLPFLPFWRSDGSSIESRRSHDVADHMLLRLASYERADREAQLVPAVSRAQLRGDAIEPLAEETDAASETSVQPKAGEQAVEQPEVAPQNTLQADEGRAEIARLTQERDQRARDAEKAHGELRAVSQELASVDSALKRERSEKARIQAEKVQAEREISYLREKAENLERQLGDRSVISRERDLLKTQLQSTEARLRMLEASEKARAKAEEEKQGALVRVNSLTMENTVLRKSVDEARRELETAKKLANEKTAERENMLRDQTDKMSIELKALREQVKRQEKDVNDVVKLRKELEEQKQRYAKLEEDLKKTASEREAIQKREASYSLDSKQRAEEIAKLQAQLERSFQDVNEMRTKLNASKRLEDKTNECQRQLLKAKNELVLARTEISELNTRMQPATDSRRLLVSPTPAPRAVAPAPAPLPTPRPSTPELVPVPVARQVVEPPLKADVLVVAVNVPKANLRSGPGEEHSSVMEISFGNRLTVEEKLGDWYRVFTPTGSRAYIRADLVTTNIDSLPVAATAPLPKGVKRTDSEEVTAPAAQRTPPPATTEELEAQRAFESLMGGFGAGSAK